MKSCVIVVILSMTSPVQRATATAYSILDFAGQARQVKGRVQRYKGKNKCKWSVSISLVNFHGKFALKLEMREFYESLHSSGAQSQASTFNNVYFLNPLYLNGQRSMSDIYGNNLVKILA